MHVKHACKNMHVRFYGEFVQFSPDLSQAWPKLADLVVFLTSLKFLVEFQRNSKLKFVMKQVPDDAGICKNKC